MDSCKDIKIVRTGKVSKREALDTVKDVIASVGLLFAFIAYFIGSVVSKACRSVRSGRFAYMMGLRRKALFGIGAGVAAFALIGLIGGIEAGLISLAVGVPLCFALIIAVRLLTND
ncbi:MAG: hypothetical protein II777_03260 [Clostridia bacterium]|nr:hypothetical protein [Clostridia bacterium]